jgi:hypothetical protein
MKVFYYLMDSLLIVYVVPNLIVTVTFHNDPNVVDRECCYQIWFYKEHTFHKFFKLGSILEFNSVNLELIVYNLLLAFRLRSISL